MKVNDWFNNGCNYQEGVLIYAGIKQSKMNLLRLFKLKQSNYNLEKLKYELSKFKEVEIKETVISEVIEKPKSTPESKPQEPAPTSNYKTLLISDLPVELHPTFIQQKNNFATACSLKIQLNRDRKSTRLNSSHITISYAVFCLKKKTNYVPAAAVIRRLQALSGIIGRKARAGGPLSLM